MGFGIDFVLLTRYDYSLRVLKFHFGHVEGSI